MLVIAIQDIILLGTIQAKKKWAGIVIVAVLITGLMVAVLAIMRRRSAAPATRAPRAPARRAARRRTSRPVARKGVQLACRTRHTRPQGRHLLLRVLAIRATLGPTAGRVQPV